MKLTKAQKIDKSKGIAEKLKAAQHLYFTEYQGLTFQNMQVLRGRIRGIRCRYSVVKNSLVRHALANAGIDGADAGILKGPVGMMAVEGDDPVAAANMLTAFAKEFPKMKIKAGYVDRQWLSAEDCKTLAGMGSKKDILAGTINVMYMAVAQAVSVVEAPVRDFLLVLKVLEEKKGASA